RLRAAYILAIPQWVVQTPSRRKHIARHAMRGVMPETARQAATKIYPTALYELAVRDRARQTVTDLLTGTVAGAAGWLDESAARGLHDSFRADGPAEEELWWPLSLEGWLRQHW
ncbi:MAG: asparagine synthase-related protein, partial [Egibacteraceae bacterium]